jgi:predicted O-methyltransferase YrrM
VPSRLAEGRWHFVVGDAKETIRTAHDFDYLFIDSDHSAPFARWYADTLLPRVRPGVVVSVHDVFHQACLSEEGQVVADWLMSRGVAYWTIASAAVPEQVIIFLKERRMFGADFESAIHTSAANPMMFFEMV